MEYRSQNFIKNYFLERLLDTRLFLFKQEEVETDFLEAINQVKKILVILPVDRVEEVNSRKFVKDILTTFRSAKISTFDLVNLRKIDTNWLGVPNHHYLENIQNEHFDLLIDLNGHHDRVCAYVAAFVKTPLRLHASHGKFEKIYNLEIRTAGDATLTERYQNIIIYLARMRTNKRTTTI
jgi:hypothetical protein